MASAATSAYHHASEFLESGQVILELPGSTKLAAIVARGFEGFLETVPPEQRNQWSLHLPDNEDPDGSPDDGFIVRKGEKKKVNAGRYDEKFLFHYRPSLIPLLRTRGIDLAPWSNWLFFCRQLFSLCHSAEAGLIAALNNQIRGYDLIRRFADPHAQRRNALRIIQYSARGVEDPLVVGKKHSDRDFLTLQVAESRSGLRLYDGSSHKPRSYQAMPDRVLAFPGKKFELLTQGKVKAIEHDIANENPASPPRWSVVFFGHIVLP